MPKFLVKISGEIPIDAGSKEEAEKIASNHRNLGCYCGFNPREVGKDCDDLGWAIPVQKGLGTNFTPTH